MFEWKIKGVVFLGGSLVILEGSVVYCIRICTCLLSHGDWMTDLICPSGPVLGCSNRHQEYRFLRRPWHLERNKQTQTSGDTSMVAVPLWHQESWESKPPKQIRPYRGPLIGPYFLAWVALGTSLDSHDDRPIATAKKKTTEKKTSASMEPMGCPRWSWNKYGAKFKEFKVFSTPYFFWKYVLILSKNLIMHGLGKHRIKKW